MSSNKSTTKTNTSSADNDDTTTMTLFTDSFNKDHVLASNFLECLEHLEKSKQVDGFDLEKAWSLFDTVDLDKRRELIKTQQRKARRAAVVTSDNFVPTGVKKPALPREMFRARFRLEQAKAKKEYCDAEFKAAWENISTKDRKALDDERAKLLDAYEEERQRQLDEQIALGNIAEKRPKSLPNAFFLFKEQVTANPSRYLKPKEVKEFESMKSIDQTKLLSTKYKDMKEKKTPEYQELEKEIESMVPLHTTEMYEWRVRNAKRLLNRANRLGEDVEKHEAELLSLENNPPEGYKATSKNATDVVSPGSDKAGKADKADKADKAAATTSTGKGSKGKGKKAGK